MKTFNKIVCTSLLVMAVLSCKKDKLNEQSPGALTAELLFQNKDGFEFAVNGLFDAVRRYRSGDTYGDINNIMNAQAVIGVDNAYGNYRDPLLDVFNYYGTYSNPSVAHYRYVFAWLYQTINSANTIVNRSANPEIVWTDADKNRILAETRLIRAWCYRHLTSLWGDVPLTLEESSGTNIRTDWQRTPIAEVRNAMKDDLLFAEQYLPETSPSDNRLLKGLAQHLLAELFLTIGDYTQARTYATKVTTNTSYRLVTARYGVNRTNPGTAFTDMFLEGNSKRSQGNTEALWIMQNEQNVIGGEGGNIMRRYWVNRYYSWAIGGKNPFPISAENGGRGIGRFSPTRAALSLFAASDDRGSGFAWRYYYILRDAGLIPTGTNPRTGTTYKLGDTLFMDAVGVEKLSNPNWPSTRKWDYVSPIDVLIDPQYNDQVMVRSAETYLLLAEANFRLNDPQGAATAINALRTRARAPLANAAQITIDFILDERTRELFSEEDRRYALTRNRKLVERVNLYNKITATRIANRDTLLPIPQDVIDANLTLKMPQNPGY